MSDEKKIGERRRKKNLRSLRRWQFFKCLSWRYKKIYNIFFVFVSALPRPFIGKHRLLCKFLYVRELPLKSPTDKIFLCLLRSFDKRGIV
jgi:hypothetical protein